MLLLVLGSSNIALAAELDDSQPVATTFVVQAREAIALHDERRNKILTVRVLYPVGTTYACPVIVFSHGAGGSKDGYQYLTRYWRSHGYICVQPTHEDAVDMSASRGSRLRQMLATLRSLPTNYKLWASRFSDISFVVSSLPFIQSQIPTNMNSNEIACAGHSLGAFTTAVLAGASVPLPGKNYASTTADGRVKAAILLSPQGVQHSDGDFGFDSERSWQELHVPALFITGTLDNTQWNSYLDRCAGFKFSPAGLKYLAIVKGASHMTFAGSSAGLDESSDTEAPASRRKSVGLLAAEEGDHALMAQSICQVTTTFLDAYLKHSPPARLELCKPEAFGPLVKVEGR